MKNSKTIPYADAERISDNLNLEHSFSNDEWNILIYHIDLQFKLCKVFSLSENQLATCLMIVSFIDHSALFYLADLTANAETRISAQGAGLFKTPEKEYGATLIMIDKNIDVMAQYLNNLYNVTQSYEEAQKPLDNEEEKP
jgi:hypothetical protein